MQKIKKLINYCLNCSAKPCKKGCPLENDIPTFISLAKNENFLEAYDVLSETTVLSLICGRICPLDQHCEKNCVRKIKGEPVQIGQIEAYIGDKACNENYPLFREVKKDNGKKVAIVGGGPAGITCAAFLKKLGYNVTIYEKYDYLGGIISHGIPSFRLDKKVVRSSLKNIIDLGIQVKYNFELGRNLSLEELKKDYLAIFLAFGANVSKINNIKGKELERVIGANEFLESQKNLDLKDKRVVVIGGGDVAMDMARTAKKWGGNVLVVYRGDENKMKANKREVELAKKENIEFLFNTIVKQITLENNVYKAYLFNNDDKFIYPCDYVFFAIGSKPEEKLIKQLGLKLDIDGYVEVNDQHMTSMEGVFAGGDLVHEKRTVAWAARSGRDAAYSIDLYLSK